MQIICTSCQAIIRVPESLAGKKGKCPNCGTLLDPAEQQPVRGPDSGDSVLEPSDVSEPAAPRAGEGAGPEAVPHAEAKAAAPSTVTEEAAVEASPNPDAPTAPSATPRPPDDEETRPPDSGEKPTAPVTAFSFLAPPQGPGEIGRLGGYRVLQVLGQGGMGVVFVAEDVALGRKLALKVMLPDMVSKAGARERFLREAQLAASIEHDHIVAIFQVGEDRGVPFIAMQLLKGCSLEEWLRKQTEWPLPIPWILKIGRQIAEGLAAAHARGLIHRDIKPANIFLQETFPTVVFGVPPPPEHRVKILDFGLVRSRTGDSNLTLSGVIMGTPSYMAPEQARSGSKIDGRADLFSLGVVLYRLCTGQLPFRGEDTMGVLMALAMDMPTPPKEINASVPSALSGLVMRLLEKDPGRRLGSAEEVVCAFEALEGIPGREAAKFDEPAPPHMQPVGRLPDTQVPDTAPTPRHLREATTRRSPAAEELPETEEAPRRGARPPALPPEEEEDWGDLRISKQEQPGLSIASMVVGIVSAVLGLFGNCCCFGYVASPVAILSGAAAIVLGFIGMKRGGRAYAYTGIALGAVGVLLALASFALLALGMGINLWNLKGR
jgi:serine/threonine protein kinase